MNKVIVIMLCTIVILGAMFTACFIYEKKQNNISELEESKISEENILDDCTEEYHQLESAKILEVNSNEIKTSPNCAFIFKIYNEKCAHTSMQYSNIPENMVNKTNKEIEKEYADYKIEKFTSNEVTFIKNSEGECGEHFLVKENQGKIAIYKLDENNKENLYEQTEIATDYLTDTDKINMENGIKVNGKQKLNQLIEDFE